MTATEAFQVPAPMKAADVTVPAAGAGIREEYARAVGRVAYLWGWPMVNMLNRRAAITKAPEPGLLNGVLPVAPRGHVGMLSDYIDPRETFVTCPNQDVVYGLGFFSLDDEPVIAQVPDFGNRSWVYAMYDARTDEFAQIGKPYGTPPGFYLLVGPSWKTGDLPRGVTAVLRSPTSLANAIPRVFMDDTPEDREAIQAVIDQIVFCPLKDFDRKLKKKDWRQVPAFPGPKAQGPGETKMGRTGEVLRSARHGARLSPAVTGRGSSLRSVPRAAGRRARRSGAQEAAGRDRGRRRADHHGTILRMEAERPPCRQRLEPVDQQRPVGSRLLQPRGHGKVEHVRQHAERDAVLLHR
jgi:hypothetical protein